MMPDDARIKYNSHKQDAKRRGVSFEITFEEWISWWLFDDRWRMRGRGKGKFVMARYGDAGPYRLGNIYCATHSQNMADSAGIKRSASAKAFHASRSQKGIKPVLAARGEGHPQSKAVLTPAGCFGSGALAAEHYGVTKEAIYYRIAKGFAGYAWAENKP